MYKHIGMIFLVAGKPHVAQAGETKVGVKVGPYNPSDWSGGRWRLPDSMLLSDWSVNDYFPGTACEPSAGAKSQMPVP